MQTKQADAYVFVDESSTHLNMIPLYARSAKGQWAYGVVPRKRGTNITLIAALNKEGLKATMTLEGSLDGEAFEVYVKTTLVPSLKPGQTVILDNLRVHKNTKARSLIEHAGCFLFFLPAYSPDLMPIEGAFSKIKAVLRSLAACTSAAFDKKADSFPLSARPSPRQQPHAISSFSRANTDQVHFSPWRGHFHA
jgi:transposase